MTKSTATENDYVKFIAHGTAIPAYGGTYQVNLHTADPGKAGVATTALPTYTAYVAQSVLRDATGLTICDKTFPYAANPAAGAFKNDDLIIFPEYEGGFVGTETITHSSISVVATGQIVRKGALQAPRTYAAGTAPIFAPGEMVWIED